MEELLKRIFGESVSEYKKISVSLPIYLTEGKEFFQVTVFGVTFVLVRHTESERLNVSALLKYARKYSEHFSMSVVYGFPQVSSRQRAALIEKQIAFAAENEQVFLPFLGTYFGRCRVRPDAHETERFSPAVQLMALYFLYSDADTKMNKAEAAEALGISAMSVTRAVRGLKRLGVLKEEKKGTEAVISRATDKQSFWEAIHPYLINPIQESVYIAAEDSQEFLLKAGEYSLSERSELGYARYREYAADKSDSVFDRITRYNPDLTDSLELVRIQRWKYDPLVLGSKDRVDPVSLICSFQGEEDERILMSLDSVREEIDTWQLMTN